MMENVYNLTLQDWEEYFVNKRNLKVVRFLIGYIVKE